MERKTDKYRDYVEHPRYGRRPHATGLNPSPMDAGVHLHWSSITHEEMIELYEATVGKRWPYGNPSASIGVIRRIRNTAVLADPAKQTRATIPVTHYFDLERQCRDCRRQFIFFALEQKHWYEELGFGLESDCVRCVECRKKEQEIASLRQQYESLFHLESKSEQQLLELAGCCIQLVEHGSFSRRRLEFARMLLNKIDTNSELRQNKIYGDLADRCKLRASASPRDRS